MTAVMPSSSGMPAATTAPKANSRISSVIGSDVNSARCMSAVMAVQIALLALASPNCSTRTPRMGATSGRGRRDGGLDVLARELLVAGDAERHEH